jgi:NTP pyrophosphatase (non-canonical NTP hydrolase)
MTDLRLLEESHELLRAYLKNTEVGDESVKGLWDTLYYLKVLIQRETTGPDERAYIVDEDYPNLFE